MSKREEDNGGWPYSRVQEAWVGTVHLLGSGAALSGKDRTTTMLALEGEETLLIVDCGGDAGQRLLAHDLDLARVTGLIVTHEHADHVGGFPLLMERLWLAGHRTEFHVYGIHTALDQAHRLHDAFDTSKWPHYPTIVYHEVPLEPGATVVTTPDFEVTAVPARHAVPSSGLRVRDVRGGGVVTYSCDTERSDVVEEQARGSNLLLHEANGPYPGHSSPEDAAAVAAGAKVERLVLVHLPNYEDGGAAVLAAARQLFPNTELGADGARYAF